MFFYPYQYITLENDENIAYIQDLSLDKPNLLFLHGNLSSASNWTRTLQALAGDYNLYALDLRGFGQSSYHHKISHLSDFAQDVKRFIQTMNLNDLTIIGWSAGGGVALEVAALLPDTIKQVILVASIGLRGFEDIIDVFPNVLPLFNPFGQASSEFAHQSIVSHMESNFRLRNRFFFQRLLHAGIFQRSHLDPTYENRLTMDAMRQQNFGDFYYSLLYFNLEEELQQMGYSSLSTIKCPVHIWHGVYDRVVESKEAYAFKAAFGKQAHLKLFKQSGHAIMDDEFELFIESIRAIV